MSAGNIKKAPIPRWAWGFAAACFVIPLLTLGGAIPSAIGAFSGLGVLAIARQSAKPAQRRVVLCGVVTGSAWTVFVVFLIALTSLQARYPSLRPGRSKSVPSESAKSTASVVEPGAPRTAELTDAQRREIYKTAVRTRYHIEFAKEQRSKVKAKGFDVSSRDRQIKRLEQMHEDHLDFVARFHKMPRSRLDEIVSEGDRNDWPAE